MRRGLRRVAVSPQAQPESRDYTFISPVAGWISNTNLSVAKPGAALVLDNWFPTKTGIRVRGGSRLYADLDSDTPVTTLFTYNVSGVSELFAATETSIWNISATPDEVVTGQASGYYSIVQFETSGGKYEFALNGEDAPQRYDGAVWIPITGSGTGAITGVTTSSLSQGWVFKNRMFFVEGGSMNAHYLAADSIAGALGQMSLAGVFQEGGSLLFGATWSVDAGDGADDRCVFVSDRGEVAIYEGTDPADPDLFSIVGRYDLGGLPMGKNAWEKFGGDLAIAISSGLVPLSQVMTKDPAELSLGAISFNIEPDWREATASRVSLPWDMVKWPAGNMLVVALPVVDETTPAYCFVCNLTTGAWARYTGWDARSVVVHEGQLYFGTTDGRVLLGETGGNDDGAVYTCSYAGHFDPFKLISRYKTLTQMRATFRSSQSFIPQLSVSTDYAQMFPSPPSSVAEYAIAGWDSGLWDSTFIWDADVSASVGSTRWVSVTGAGFAHSPQLQITFGITPTPSIELMVTAALYQPGNIVT